MPKRRRDILPPGASVTTFGQRVAQLYPLRGQEWDNVPLLSIFRPPGSTHTEDEQEVEWLDDQGRLQVNTVRRQDCRRVRLKSSSYNNKEAKGLSEEDNDPWMAQKDQVNRVVAYLLQHLPRTRREVVLLDHYRLRTSRALVPLGFRRSQLHLPNPDPHFVSSTHSSWLERHVTYTPETLFEWINRQDTEDEDLVAAFDVLADYCCTWEGDAKCQPSVDLHALFRKTLLAKKNGVLWLTFSTRGSSAHDVLASVKAWVQQEALHFDYTLSVAYEKTYGHIVTLVYVTGRANVHTDFTFLEAL